VSLPSDFELLEAWREGDRIAGGALFDRHLASVSRFFKNKIDGDIEDLVQDTFLASVEGRDRFEGRSSFRTYLFSIARHLLFAHFRGRAKDFDPLGSSVVALGVSMGSMIARSEEQRMLLRALRTLSIDLQVALELYYWEGLTGSELAEILEVSPHTVRSRLSRARAALKTSVEDLATSPEIGASTVAELDALVARLGPRRTG